MKKFNVEIMELLARTEVVEAENAEDALRKIQDLYDSQKIILTAEDYCDTTFEVTEAEE